MVHTAHPVLVTMKIKLLLLTKLRRDQTPKDLYIDASVSDRVSLPLGNGRIRQEN